MAKSELVQKLDSLSEILNHLNISHAKELAAAFNRRLEGLLEAHLIIARLYWREPSRGGGNLLRPITHVKGKDFTSVTDPEPFVISPAEPDGILSWSFIKEKSVWVENLDVANDATIIFPEKDDNIPREYLENQYSPSSMLVFPLKYQGFVIGVYCIDLAHSGVVTHELFSEMQIVRECFSRLLVVAHQQKERFDRSDRAVKNFLDDVREIMLPRELLQVVSGHRRAFFARPFEDEFSALEKTIASIMQDLGVEATSYSPSGDTSSIIVDIIRQIQESHIGIADITGSNPNVLAEVGMMLMIDKPVILFRSKNDTGTLPFNIAHRIVFEYSKDPSSSSYLTFIQNEQNGIPLDECIKSFVDDLKNNNEKFRNATLFTPSKTTQRASKKKVAKKTGKKKAVSRSRDKTKSR